jgi:hypothetical protein
MESSLSKQLRTAPPSRARTLNLRAMRDSSHHSWTFILCLLCSCVLIESCGSTYFADTAPAPLFTRPWQGNVQANISSQGALYFQAASSLPADWAAYISHEPWSKGSTSDQLLTSIAMGHFWGRDNLLAGAFAGYGWGVHRYGEGFERRNNLANSYDVDSAFGYSNFRMYYVDGYFADVTFGQLDSTLITNAYGFGFRMGYLDTYFTSNSSVTTVTSPARSIYEDVIVFGTLGIEYAQLFAQLLLRFQDGILPIAAGGVRFAF